MTSSAAIGRDCSVPPKASTLFKSVRLYQKLLKCLPKLAIRHGCLQLTIQGFRSNSVVEIQFRSETDTSYLTSTKIVWTVGKSRHRELRRRSRKPQARAVKG